MKQFYAVRHGQSVLNVTRTFAGRADTPLTDVGREQAKRAGEKIIKLNVDLIVSSPLSRALETAQIIAESIGYTKDILISELFVEQALGSLEGKSWDEDIDEDEQTGIESDKQLAIRAKQALNFLENRSADNNILLVSHGTFIRYLQSAIKPSGTYEEPENSEIIQLLP
jgi:broad specificity phosphatase PhoE